MEAKELMIGDWACLHDTPCQVSWLADDDDECDRNIAFYGHSAAQNDSWVHPIPLTEGILKANGFEQDGCYLYKQIDKFKYLQYYLNEKRLTLYWEGVDEWQNHAHVREDCFICKELAYVHQVQHALRLCGLDELADNFKVV